MKVITTDTDGTERTFTVKPFGDFTIRDWKALCLPVHDLTGIEALHEELKRITGMPLKILRRLPPSEVESLIDALIEVRTEAEKAHALASETAKTWDTDGPKSITFGGKVYDVPEDLERGTVYGQWQDLSLALDGAEHEPEIMAAVCACLLVEQGKEYEGYHNSLEAFEAMPARDAMAVVAFFLSKGNRLKDAISQSLMRRVMSLQQELEPAEASTTTSTSTGTA